MSPISLIPASAQDAEAIARLQAQSWRITYRGMLPDDYLDHHVVADRLAYWPTRFAKFASDRTLVLKQSARTLLLVSVLWREPWGARWTTCT